MPSSTLGALPGDHRPPRSPRGYPINTTQVIRLLTQADVRLRSPAEQNRITAQRRARRRQLHQPLALPVPGQREEQVLEAYCDRKLTLAASGQPLGLTSHQVLAILRQHGVQRRRAASCAPKGCSSPAGRCTTRRAPSTWRRCAARSKPTCGPP
jgi:hypothetical protein